MVRAEFERLIVVRASIRNRSNACFAASAQTRANAEF
jgi:hypothetical protein